MMQRAHEVCFCHSSKCQSPRLNNSKKTAAEEGSDMQPDKGTYQMQHSLKNADTLTKC